MAWKVSSCSSGDTGSAARSMMSSCERVFSGPWGARGGQGDEAGYVILQLALIISVFPNVVLFNPSL